MVRFNLLEKNFPRKPRLANMTRLIAEKKEILSPLAVDLDHVGKFEAKYPELRGKTSPFCCWM